MFLVSVLLVFCLIIPSALTQTVDVDITFAWEQVMAVDLDGWRMYVSNTAGGPYTQLGPDFVYDGTPLPTYTNIFTATAPGSSETTFYFVVTAYDTDANESGYSNEVSHTVDLLSPDSPTNLRITFIFKVGGQDIKIIGGNNDKV